MNILKVVLIGLVKIYKIIISPFLGNNCRYLPTCSDYFIDCLNEYGLIKGILKGTKKNFFLPSYKVFRWRWGF